MKRVLLKIRSLGGTYVVFIIRIGVKQFQRGSPSALSKVLDLGH